mgnify:CR=1 FL=1|jgi:hypothetical protein
MDEWQEKDTAMICELLSAGMDLERVANVLELDHEEIIMDDNSIPLHQL